MKKQLQNRLCIITKKNKMGILPNDTRQWVRGFTDTFYHGKVDRIGVELEEIEE